MYTLRANVCQKRILLFDITNRNFSLPAYMFPVRKVYCVHCYVSFRSKSLPRDNQYGFRREEKKVDEE